MRQDLIQVGPRIFVNSAEKRSAPIRQEFFNKDIHKPWVDLKDSQTPADYCKLWQTDSCVKPAGEKCSRWHLCKFCGGAHPASQCYQK